MFSIQVLDITFVSVNRRHRTFYFSCISYRFFIDLNIDLSDEENELCTGWAKILCSLVGSGVTLEVILNEQYLRLQCLLEVTPMGIWKKLGMQPEVFYVWDFPNMQHSAARPSCTGAQGLFAYPVVSSCYAVSSSQAHNKL